MWTPHIYILYTLRYTIDKNDISAPKSELIYGVIQLVINIRLFSIAPYKILTFYAVCFIFFISSLLLSLIALSLIIALPNIAIAIVLARKSTNYFNCNSLKSNILKKQKKNVTNQYKKCGKKVPFDITKLEEQ